MDHMLAAQIFAIALWALSIVVTLLVAYWVIRLAITHSLRSHHYWLQKNAPRR